MAQEDLRSFYFMPKRATARDIFVFQMYASLLRQNVTALREHKDVTIKKNREGIKFLSENLGMNLKVEGPPMSYVRQHFS